MNGDDVRNMTFARRWRAYAPSQVDEFLARVAEELDAGRAAWPLIECVEFDRVVYGYDISAVDAFLDRFRRQESDYEPARMRLDPWRDLAVWKSDRSRAGEDFALDCAGAWRDFGQVPGTRLTWEWTGVKRHELRTDDGQTLASFRPWRFAEDWHLPGSFSFHGGHFGAGGSTFEVRGVRKADWPNIAQAFSLSPISMGEWGNQIVYAAGLPILIREGIHFNRSAGAHIKLCSDQRLLRFPVRGFGLGNAIMTAVDQAGNKVARYRRFPAKHWWSIEDTAEIMVHPEQRLTDDLAVAIALAVPWLWQYFQSGRGGG